MKKQIVEKIEYTIDDKEALTIASCLVYCKHRITVHGEYHKPELKKIIKLLKVFEDEN